MRQQDEIVVGGGAGFELGRGGEGLAGFNRLQAGGERGGSLVSESCWQVACSDWKRPVRVSAAWGGASLSVNVTEVVTLTGVALPSFQQWPVGGVRVGVDGRLTEKFGAIDGADGGDVTGGVDGDFKMHDALDVRGFSICRIDDRGALDGLVLAHDDAADRIG